MYIRLKTIKKHKYAYLTKNIRYKKRKHPKQKTIQYLGRVCPLIKTSFIELDQESIESLNFKDSVKTIISFELRSHNFKQKDNILFLDGLTLNLDNLTITLRNKPITLSVNEGFLNNYTLNSLIEFKPTTDNQILEGKKLAKLFIASGVNIKPETFVLLFQKLYKKQEE